MSSPLAPLYGKLPNGWRCWVGIGGMLYARYSLASPPIVIRADNADDLKTKVLIAEIDIRR